MNSLPLPILSNSRMKNARACLRLDKYRYRLGYKTAGTSLRLRFGTLVHAALEAWWIAWLLAPDERLAKAIDAMAGESDPYERAKAEALIVGYHERWQFEPLQTLAVEAEFEGPLVNPKTGAESRTWRRGGKIDAIARHAHTGETLLVEHKTAGEDIRQGSIYWQRLRMDSQVSTYFEGGRLLGYKVDRCVYDVIFKPKISPKDIPVVDDEGVKIVRDANGERVRTKNGKKWRETGDTEAGYVVETRRETPDEYKLRLLQEIAADPEAYFQRGEVVRLEDELREALLDDWHFARFLRDSVREDIAPRNPDACLKYGSTCDYFGVCTGADSLDNETRFVRVRPNEELSDALVGVDFGRASDAVVVITSVGVAPDGTAIFTAEEREGEKPEEKA